MTEPLAALAAALPFPLPGEWVLQGGAVGLLGLVVLMILLGQLVPRRHVSALERDRDLWRDVALRAMGQSDVLLPAAQISTEIARALSDVAQRTPAPAVGAGDGTRPAP